MDKSMPLEDGCSFSSVFFVGESFSIKVHLHSLKLTANAPEKKPKPKGKLCLLTNHFHGLY